MPRCGQGTSWSCPSVAGWGEISASCLERSPSAPASCTSSSGNRGPPVSNLPTLRDGDLHGRPVPIGTGGTDPRLPDDGQAYLRLAVAVLVRSKWLILACALAGWAAGSAYTRTAQRVYAAAVTLRVEEKR